MNAVELNELLNRGRAAVWSHEERLTQVVQRILEREASAVARRFLTKATSLTAAAVGVEKTSTMVAVYPTPGQQQTLASQDGQPAATIHCTLVFLGDTTEGEYAALVNAMQGVAAAQTGPLEGAVGGVASFAEGPDGHPSICLPDVPGLAELRDDVAEVCAQSGFSVASNHGWTPHLTIAYTPDPSPPDESTLGQELTFSHLSIVRGDVMRTDIPLSGVLTAAAAAPAWSPPHPDEIVNAGKLEAQFQTAIGGERQGALKSFGAEMPTCLATPESAVDYDLKDLAAHFSGWRSDLSIGEREAFRDYRAVGGTYHLTNRFARGELHPTSEEAITRFSTQIRLMDEALDQGSLPAGTVYRGISDVERVFDTDDPRTLIGKLWHDDSYMSTSADVKVAEGFAEKRGAMIRIKVPDGTRGAYMTRASATSRRSVDEAEVLLPRGTTLKIDSAVRAENGMWTLTAEVVKDAEAIRGSAGRHAAWGSVEGEDAGGTRSTGEAGEEVLTAAALGCDGASLRWDVKSPFFGKTLARTGEHVAAISDTTRGDVMGAIDRAYSEGLSVRDAAQSIQDVLRGSAPSRAATIARTELNRLANGASFNAVQVFGDATGVSHNKTWLTAPGAPHPRHELDDGLNGQTVPMDQPFDVNGAPLMYPGDPDGDPGETVNCRCVLIYAETGEGIDSDALMTAAGILSPSNPSGTGDMMADALETFDSDDMPCADCEHAMSSHQDGEGMCSAEGCSCKSYATPTDGDGDAPDKEPDNDEAAITADGVMAAAQWEAVLCPEGKATEDGRIMAPGSISWRELPLSLMAMVETSEGGHVGAELCGRIDSIWKDNGDRMTLVNGSGVFDSGDYGSEISRLVGDQTLRGNSVDLAIREFTIGKRADYADEDGFWIGPDSPPDEADVDFLDLLFGDGDDLLFVVWDAVIGMSTVCPFPAFEEASITLVAAGEHGMRFRVEGDHTALRMRVYSDGAMKLIVDDSITASAAGLAPETPPAEWFDDPVFDGPTALTVTDDGQIFGHAWTWDTCHTAFPSRCVTAPHSQTDYALFHLKEVEVDTGDKIACGTITLDAPHASQSASRKEAMSHYENTGAAVADVRVGEDEHGGWVVGALRPDASAVSVRKLRGAVLSGDWRGWEGNLELIGLLAVNIPGFPVPRRAEAVVASGKDGDEVVALLAAGIVTHGSVGEIDKARLLALGARAEGGLEALAALASSAEGCGCVS